MSGLDKIIDQIREEAEASSAEILDEAKEKAKELKDEADKECRKEMERAAAQNEAVREDILNKSRSSAQMDRRREMLFAKQEMIDEVIREAHETMLAFDQKAYFEALAKLIAKYAQPQSGQIRFNQKDLDRLPENFAGIAQEAAQKKSGALVISDVPAEIDGGFLLIYGDIEENCSFDALFLSERENLQDKLHTFLFA